MRYIHPAPISNQVDWPSNRLLPSFTIIGCANPLLLFLLFILLKDQKEEEALRHHE
jgi:hypothetical protein